MPHWPQAAVLGGAGGNQDAWRQSGTAGKPAAAIGPIDGRPGVKANGEEIVNRKFVPVVLACLLLAACASKEDAQQQAAANQAEQAKHEARCSSFGLKPGTQDFSECLMRQSTTCNSVGNTMVCF